jgi:hypothetical protein
MPQNVATEARSAYFAAILAIYDQAVITSCPVVKCPAMKRNNALARYHEAGHAVVAHLLGIHVKRVTIVPDPTRGNVGHVHHGKVIRGRAPDYNDSPRTQRLIENSVRIALAGHVAQKIYAPRSYYGAAEDHRDAFGWALTVNHDEQDTANAWFKWLELDVTHLLKSRWEFVEAVAAELLKSETLNAEQFQAVWQRVLDVKLKAQYPDGLPVVTRTASA